MPPNGGDKKFPYFVPIGAGEAAAKTLLAATAVVGAGGTYTVPTTLVVPPQTGYISRMSQTAGTAQQGSAQSDIVAALRVLTSKVDALTPPPKQGVMGGVKEWAPIWAPFLAMLVPTAALLLTAVNFGGQIAALSKLVHDDFAVVGTRLDALGNRITAVETTIKVQKSEAP